MGLADDASAVAMTQGWLTVWLTAALVVITGWTTYLNFRLTKSTEAAADSARVAAEASRSAALVATATSRVEFDLVREYVPQGTGEETAGVRMMPLSGRKRPDPGFILRTLYVLPVDAAVYIHGAVLTCVGARDAKADVTVEMNVAVPLQGPKNPHLVHASEAVAFRVPDIFSPSDSVGKFWGDGPVHLVVCRVSYSFDGVGPIRERMVANYRSPALPLGAD